MAANNMIANIPPNMMNIPANMIGGNISNMAPKPLDLRSFPIA